MPPDISGQIYTKFSGGAKEGLGGGLQPPCRGGLGPLSGKITDFSGENEKTFKGRLTSTILLPN